MRNILPERPNKSYDLVVRGIPFGGHNNGKDDDGQYFHADTNISSHPVPIMYAHGNQINSTESLKGQIYGITQDIWKEGDGFYYGVDIFEDAELEDSQGNKQNAKTFFRESARNNQLFASVGGLDGTAVDIDSTTGAINKVSIAELSLIDKRLTPYISPKNYYAVARLKAQQNFVKAGLILDTPNNKVVCKCGCGLNSATLFEDNLSNLETDGLEKACDCTTNKCSTKPKGVKMLDKLKALLAGKKDGEDVTPEEIQTLMKAGESQTITTSTTNIADIVKSAVESATKPLTDEINKIKTEFQTQLTVMKATQDTNAFNKYLGTMLNVKLTADEVASYGKIYETLAPLDETVKENSLTVLKAQIEAKSLLVDLTKNGRILDEPFNGTNDFDTQAALSSAVHSALGNGGNQENTTLLKAFAENAIKTAETNAGGKK